ncbi:hypothetical protein BKA65DRAFT_36846 [Rhexocercosporidium sp. MPI-PUGE-AT-0058]|nr:hypothetical protein BKA65DRAFT_36846 [Rhexocercosporidium sp. MPI-PUGE-AT-0058]
MHVDLIYIVSPSASSLFLTYLEIRNRYRKTTTPHHLTYNIVVKPILDLILCNLKMTHPFRPLVAIFLFISALTLTLAFPTTDLSPTPELASTLPTSINTDISALPPSILESNNYVCQEGCRRPCFDYAYCSSCDDLTGWEYIFPVFLYLLPSIFIVVFFLSKNEICRRG